MTSEFKDTSGVTNLSLYIAFRELIATKANIDSHPMLYRRWKEDVVKNTAECEYILCDGKIILCCDGWESSVESIITMEISKGLTSTKAIFGVKLACIGRLSPFRGTAIRKSLVDLIAM